MPCSLVRVSTFQSNLPHLPSDPPAHIYQTTQRHIPEHTDLRIMTIRQCLFLRCSQKTRLLTQWRLDTVKYVTIEYSCCLLRSPAHWLHSLGFSCFSLAPTRQILEWCLSPSHFHFESFSTISLAHDTKLMHPRQRPLSSQVTNRYVQERSQEEASGSAAPGNRVLEVAK
jgi:hypothetical protein